MAWNERYQAGRFRDAVFVTERHSHVGGRRLAVHEYPQREEPYVEDLGAALRAFSLDLLVLGADYMDARDALTAALNAPGPGTLVHPYLGSLRVAVERYRLQESTRQGGVARFLVDFVEAGENTFPTSTANTGAVVNTRAETALNATQADFVEAYTVDGTPEFVAAAAEDRAGDALRELRSLANQGVAIGRKKTAFLRASSQALAGLSSTVLEPAGLAGELLAQVSGLGELWTLPRTALARYRALFGYGSVATSTSLTATPSRTRQADNRVAIQTLVRQAAVIEAARASRDVTFDSLDDAQTVRDELAEQLDEEMLIASDATYPVLADLRVAVIRDISARGANLARIRTYRPLGTQPALVLAHRLYGDASKDSEVIDRNRSIRHPGFVRGAAPLEVLTDVG